MSEFAFEGPRWPSDVITWSFADINYQADTGTRFSDPIVNPAEQYIVEAAFQTWQVVTGVTFVQVPDAPNFSQAADIRVGFGKLNTPSDGDEIGETDYYFNPNTNTFEPDVIIRLEDPQIVPLTVDQTGTTIWSGTDTSLYQVALHEIGHALGLDHSTDPAAVMFPVGTDLNRQLSSADIQGIDALYGPPVARALVVDRTAGTTSLPAMVPVSIAGSPLQYAFTDLSPDNLYISTTAPNAFLQAGNGNNTLQVSSGDNVLDGGDGSNVMIGGVGTDSFFLDGAGPNLKWSTIADFHSGDTLLLFGWQGNASAINFTQGGFPGAEGATIAAGTFGAGANENITFDGVSVAQAQSSIALASGNSGGTPFLAVHYI